MGVLKSFRNKSTKDNRVKGSTVICFKSPYTIWISFETFYAGLLQYEDPYIGTTI